MSRQSANLDFVRSFAVSCVLVSHTATALGVRQNLDGVARTGVLLFFVHTCYVLLLSLGRLHAVGSGSVALPFYTQRIFRIYPLYLAAIAVTLVFRVPWIDTFGLHPSMQWLGWQWFVAHLLLIQNLNRFAFSAAISRPMWTLPYEIQMYLALPAVYLLARSKEAISKLVLLGFLVGLLGLMFGIAMTCFVPCFLGGAYAFVIAAKPYQPRWPFLWLPLLLSAVAVVVSLAPQIVQIPVQWGVCTAFGFLLPCVCEMTGTWFKRICHYMARYSYGVYLWHWPLLWFCFRGTGTLPVLGQITLFVCTLGLLCIASYHVLEYPLIEAGRRVARKKASPRLTASLTSIPVVETI